jgi:transposase
MIRFRFERLHDLLRQLMVSSPEVRGGHTDRLEALLDDLEPDRLYPHDFVYFRITGYRPQEPCDDTFSGHVLLSDLLRMLREVGATVPINVADADEEVLALADVAGECGVSERTVRRWLDRALPARTYYFPDGRKRLGVRRGALRRFRERNPDALESSRRFSKLTKAEQQRILEMAGKLADGEDLTLTAAAGRIAEALGRSPEAIRLFLIRRDEQYSGSPLFGRKAALRDGEGTCIWSDFRRGMEVRDICERYGRSRASVYRIINQERAAEALTRELTYHRERASGDPGAESAVLPDGLGALLEAVPARVAPDAEVEPGEPPFRWRRSPLTGAQEKALFRAYNYLKFRMDELRSGLNVRRYVPARTLDEFDALGRQARAVHDTLVGIHLPLVDHLAREHATSEEEMDALLVAGRAHLSVLIDEFDYRGRARFPGYANLELLKAFAVRQR